MLLGASANLIKSSILTRNKEIKRAQIKSQENVFGCFFPLDSFQKIQKYPQNTACPKCLIFPFPSDLCEGQPFWSKTCTEFPAALFTQAAFLLAWGQSVFILPLTQQSSYTLPLPHTYSYGAQVQLNSNGWVLGETVVKGKQTLSRSLLQASFRLLCVHTSPPILHYSSRCSCPSGPASPPPESLLRLDF